MATVNISITTKKQSVPASPAAGSAYRYQLVKDGVVAHTTAVSALSINFTGVIDGVYTAVVQRLATDNSPIGDAATSAPFTVQAMALIDVPDVVTVTF
jgi:hypothetical protein